MKFMDDTPREVCAGRTCVTIGEAPPMPPVKPARPEVNAHKQKFMLDYILNARLNGRTQDLGSSYNRREIVEAADDLYEKVYAACKVK